MISLSGVHKGFRREGHFEPLLEGIDLHVPAGARWGLIGPGAAGKSVLAKLMCGLVVADSGSIRVAGRDITAGDDDAVAFVRARIGMLFQSYALFDFMSVAENVAFPLRRRGGLAEDDLDKRVRDRLRAVGLAGAEDKRPAELSGGMKRRVGIARATITQSEIVIYDEPTAGLDPVTTSKIYDLLLADHAATGNTVIAISSDVDALRRFAPRIAMLQGGKLRYDGPADAIADAEDAVVRQFVRGEIEGPL